MLYIRTMTCEADTLTGRHADMQMQTYKRTRSTDKGEAYQAVCQRDRAIGMWGEQFANFQLHTHTETDTLLMLPLSLQLHLINSDFWHLTWIFPEKEAPWKAAALMDVIVCNTCFVSSYCLYYTRKMGYDSLCYYLKHLYKYKREKRLCNEFFQLDWFVWTILKD